jgi:hypothetical protein
MQAAPGILQWLQGLFSGKPGMTNDNLGQQMSNSPPDRLPLPGGAPAPMPAAVQPQPQPQMGAGMSFTPPLPADMPLAEEPYDPLTSVMTAMQPPAAPVPRPRPKPARAAAPAAKAKPAAVKPKAKPTKKDPWAWHKARMRERQPY